MTKIEFKSFLENETNSENSHDKYRKVKVMLSCNEHDYIEIACMYQYPIKITMKTGEIIECTTLDTHYNSEREECIKVDVAGIKTEVIINNIAKIEVCIENPYFEEISFT